MIDLLIHDLNIGPVSSSSAQSVSPKNHYSKIYSSHYSGLINLVIYSSLIIVYLRICGGVFVTMQGYIVQNDMVKLHSDEYNIWFVGVFDFDKCKGISKM